MKILKIFKRAYPEHYDVYKATVVDIFGQETLRTLVLRYEEGEKMTKLMPNDTQRDYMYQKHISALALLKHHIPEDGMDIGTMMISDINCLICKFQGKVPADINKRAMDYRVSLMEKQACDDLSYAKVFMQTYRGA